MKPSSKSCSDEALISQKLEPPYVGCYDIGALTTELLIMPDGQILVHNLTQPFAELLSELNPNCEQIHSRITSPASPSHELPD